jgi:hypothetical protein
VFVPRGQHMEAYAFKTPQNLGSLQSIRFSSSQAYGCFLWKVVVEDRILGKMYTFPYELNIGKNVDKAIFLDQNGL